MKNINELRDIIQRIEKLELRIESTNLTGDDMTVEELEQLKRLYEVREEFTEADWMRIG